MRALAEKPDRMVSKSALMDAMGYRARIVTDAAMAA